MRVLVLWLVALGASPLLAFDFGGSVDTAASYSFAENPSATSTSTVKLWATGSLGGIAFLARGNLTNAFSQDLGATPLTTNTLSGGLETLALDAGWFRLGRADFRDFGGVVLNTKLDGALLHLTLAKVDFRAYAGSSMALFKSASTIVISEEDTKDRQVFEDWRQPSTLWAPPRVVAGLEASATQWLRDQAFHLALLGQADLRANSPVNDGRANTSVSDRVGAPVSTAYAGLGWSGRLIGPLYGSAWAYGSGGTSLTAVGTPITEAISGKQSTEIKYQTWKSSLLAGALANAELTLLLPWASFLLVNAGIQVGSWDPDGATPDKNTAKTPTSLEPTLYTGWTGISRTGGALVFNPQPANLAQGRLVVSIRPVEGLQIATSTFVSYRPTKGDISEPGIRPGSEALYLGTETDVAVLWRPASDLGLTLSGGAFVPNNQALSRTVETKIQATVNLSF